MADQERATVPAALGLKTGTLGAVGGKTKRSHFIFEKGGKLVRSRLRTGEYNVATTRKVKSFQVESA
ncbi:hypothetical protein C8J57DRAFT_1526739 [Mycena rebaudengoi]|nr:hypothetical protein C8J57DRAFT_1526739 [Mycena rebaudengoi]